MKLLALGAVLVVAGVIGVAGYFGSATPRSSDSQAHHVTARSSWRCLRIIGSLDCHEHAHGGAPPVVNVTAQAGDDRFVTEAVGVLEVRKAMRRVQTMCQWPCQVWVLGR